LCALLAGNELSGTGVGTRIGADQYAADVIALKRIVDDIHRSNPSKPLVLAPGGFFDQGWFTELIVKTKPNLLNVITHHIYNLGPGMRTDSYFLDGFGSRIQKLK
jgi:heparanase 1